MNKLPDCLLPVAEPTKNAKMHPCGKKAVLVLAQDLIKQLAHSSFCFEYRVTMVHGSR
jgi:hypothetical protein